MKTQLLKSILKVAERPSFIPKATISHLRDMGFPETALSSLERCGYFTGQYVFKECGCGVEAIRVVHNCNNRTCPRCAKLRKNRIFSRFLPFFKRYQVTRACFFQFLTISPPNYKNFDEGLNHLQKSFAKFIRRKYIKERIKAGFYVIETKQGAKGWNIHLHAVLYGRWLDYRHRGLCRDCGQNLLKYNKISKKFYCANRTCNSLNVVKKPATRLNREWLASAKQPAHIHGERVRSIYGAVDYLAKYISMDKSDFLNPQSHAQYIFGTYKKKLINAFGLFFRKHKRVKSPYICQKCKCNIYYFYDATLSQIYFEKDHKPPDNTPQKVLGTF